MNKYDKYDKYKDYNDFKIKINKINKKYNTIYREKIYDYDYTYYYVLFDRYVYYMTLKKFEAINKVKLSNSSDWEMFLPFKNGKNVILEKLEDRTKWTHNKNKCKNRQRDIQFKYNNNLYL